jgi:hypothetical protein
MGRNAALEIRMNDQDDPWSEGKWLRTSPLASDTTETKPVIATAYGTQRLIGGIGSPESRTKRYPAGIRQTIWSQLGIPIAPPQMNPPATASVTRSVLRSKRMTWRMAFMARDFVAGVPDQATARDGVADTTDRLRASCPHPFALVVVVVLIAAYLLRRHPMTWNQVSESKVDNTVR